MYSNYTETLYRKKRELQYLVSEQNLYKPEQYLNPSLILFLIIFIMINYLLSFLLSLTFLCTNMCMH